MELKLLFISLIWIILGSTAWAQSQYNIQFNYDSAGNQTLRDRVCVNCATSKDVVDSIQVREVAQKEGLLAEASIDGAESNTSYITAYPNPVTDLLSVEWQDTQKKVTQFLLFSGVGQQLQQIQVGTNRGRIEIDFSVYPTGNYIVSVQYADNTLRSFHVIKK